MGGTKTMSFGAWTRHAAFAAALSAVARTVSGGRVSETDVKSWETTQPGPYKLVAVIPHDK
jgi:hypothetical protein